MSREVLGGFYDGGLRTLSPPFLTVSFPLSLSSNNFVLSLQENQGAQRNIFKNLSTGRQLRSKIASCAHDVTRNRVASQYCSVSMGKNIDRANFLPVAHD